MRINYLSKIYSTQERPLTNYPYLLAKRLTVFHGIDPGSKMLEIGTGRGEVAKSFNSMDIDVTALDRDETFRKDLENIGINFVCHDVFEGPLPFEDNSFDIVYTKSFLEHLPNPEELIIECYRVLKPDGKVLNLVPDWESNYKIFFDDPTHKTPFTTETIRNLYLMCGFKPGIIQRIRQLPITWKYSFLKIPLDIIALFVPVRTRNKFLRWTRELMIESVGIKKD